MPRPKRIVCYAINGSGLGHVTRLLGVARWMRRMVTFLDGKPPEIFFLSSSEAPQLTLAAGFPTFKLPSKTVARQAGMDMLEYRRLAKHFIWNTLGVFQPDLLVVDTFPSGSFDELFQVLDGPFKKGLILREVKPQYAARPTFRAALKLYDRLLVPSDAAAVARMKLPAGLEPRPVGRLTQLDGAEFMGRAAARAELNVSPDLPLVYLSAGGGGDATSVVTLRDTVAGLLGETQAHVLVGAGPLYRGPRIHHPRVIWSTEPNLARVFPACDVAISAAGYNTFHELMLARVPSIFLAQDKIADDQAARVARAVELGAAQQADDPMGAVAAVVELVADPRRAAAMAEAAGAVHRRNNADRCAGELLSALYSTRDLDRARSALTQEFVHRVEARVPDVEMVYGRVLQLLLPPQLFEAGEGGLLDRIRDQLSEQAAREVEAALAASTSAGVVAAVQSLLPDLLSLGEPNDVVGAVEVGLRKHPVALNGDSERWVSALLKGLAGVLKQGPETTTLYRYWPKIVDADVETSLSLFHRFVQGGSASNTKPWELQRQLSGFKAAVKKVTVNDVEGLLRGQEGS